MIELLFTSSFWPWLIVALFIIVCGLSAFFETIGLAIIGVLIFSGATWLLYDAGPLPWVLHNPGKTIVFGLVYVAIGAMWSLFKWTRRLSSSTVKTAIDDGKVRFLESNKKGSDDEYYDNYNFPWEAHPSYNVDRITSWMALWPLSAFLFVFDDLLINFFHRISKRHI